MTCLRDIGVLTPLMSAVQFAVVVIFSNWFLNTFRQNLIEIAHTYLHIIIILDDIISV